MGTSKENTALSITTDSPVQTDLDQMLQNADYTLSATYPAFFVQKGGKMDYVYLVEQIW